MSAEMKKEAPSFEKINEAARVVKKHLEQAEDFEVKAEQRICQISDDHGSRENGGNLSGDYSHRQ